jgi:hypothetical protein
VVVMVVDLESRTDFNASTRLKVAANFQPGRNLQISSRAKKGDGKAVKGKGELEKENREWAQGIDNGMILNTLSK